MMGFPLCGHVLGVLTSEHWAPVGASNVQALAGHVVKCQGVQQCMSASFHPVKAGLKTRKIA